MSPSHVFEPTYLEIRSRIVRGVWLPGARLEATRIADDLGVSMTPVRDCLNRLVGEGLAELQYGHGFCVARMSEQDLRDLLALNLTLLLSVCGSPLVPLPALLPVGASDSAARTAQLFEELAAASGNRELLDRVRWLNDRLHVVRMNDEAILGEVAVELADLEAGAATATGELSSRLVRYHVRRQREAAAYLRLLHQRLP